MASLLAYSIALLIAVLVSGLAARSVLSSAVLFLAVGILLGNGALGFVSFTSTDPAVTMLAELALFSVLFTDALHIGFADLRKGWRSPGRALFFGLPLTLLLTSLLAHFLLGLHWSDSLLIGAALSPTDPVLSAAIVGREEVPARLRHLLNVESGLNDGLALPIVLVLLSLVRKEPLHPLEMIENLAFGVLIGVAVPIIFWLMEKIKYMEISVNYQPLSLVAIGMTVYGLTKVTHTNSFLAAFAAGVTLATLSPQLRDSFRQFGEVATELLKLAALFVFGALITPTELLRSDPSDYVFVILVLFAARPVAIELSLLGSKLDWRERLAAAWFGPKGFASVVFALLILQAGFVNSEYLYHVVALVVAGSIVAHSSTDVLVARWFHRVAERDHPPKPKSRKPPEWQPS